MRKHYEGWVIRLAAKIPRGDLHSEQSPWVQVPEHALGITTRVSSWAPNKQIFKKKERKRTHEPMRHSTLQLSPHLLIQAWRHTLLALPGPAAGQDQHSTLRLEGHLRMIENRHLGRLAPGSGGYQQLL